MKLTKRIIVFGNSLGVVIDKAILEKLKIKKGDLVEIDIKNAK